MGLRFRFGSSGRTRTYNPGRLMLTPVVGSYWMVRKIHRRNTCLANLNQCRLGRGFRFFPVGLLEGLLERLANFRMPGAPEKTGLKSFPSLPSAGPGILLGELRAGAAGGGSKIFFAKF